MAPLKQCLGIDLGFNSVKIVELALDRNSVRVVRAASAPTGATPSMSPEEVRTCMVTCARDLLKKGRFGVRKAVFSISGHKVFIRRFRLPKTSEERIARIIQYEARQQIPFPLDKTSLQYQHREIPEENEVEVLLVAVRTDEVRDFMQIVNRLPVKPVCVAVSSFALFSANRFLGLTEEQTERVFEQVSARKKKAKKPKKAKKGAPVEEEAPELDEEGGEEEFVFEEVKGFVNIGATSLDLAIGKTSDFGSNIGFVRTVPHGGNEMTNAIMRTCQVDSFHDAERIKTSSTQLMSFNFDFEDEETINQEASGAVTEVTDRLVTELRRTLDYYITQPDGMAIDNLVLCGGQAQLKGIDSYLEEKLTVPVTLVSEIPESSPLKWQESHGPISPFVISVGLALQGLGLSDLRIDFLPEERKITRDFPYKMAAVMVLLLAGTAGIASQAGKDYAQKYAQEAQRLQQDIMREQRQVEVFEQAQGLHDDVANRFVELSRSFGQRDYWVEFLIRLTEALPPDVMLEDIRLNHDGEVRIQGLSEEPVSAANMASALERLFRDRLREARGEETNPSIEDVSDLGEAPPYWGNPRPPQRFVLTMRMRDKFNHLDVTPTPSPTPVGGGFGGGMDGFFGGFGPGGVGGGRR